MALLDLFRPKWKHSKAWIRDKEVKSLDPEKNQNLLSYIAVNDKDEIVRNRAIERLDPEKWKDLLAYIAKNDIDYIVRKEALKKIINQNVIVEIAKEDIDSAVREAAVEKLDSDKWQELLADIAKNDGDYEVRCAAKAKVKHSEILANKDKGELISKSKKEKIKDILIMGKLIAEISVTINEEGFKKGIKVLLKKTNNLNANIKLKCGDCKKISLLKDCIKIGEPQTRFKNQALQYGFKGGICVDCPSCKTGTFIGLSDDILKSFNK